MPDDVPVRREQVGVGPWPGGPAAWPRVDATGAPSSDPDDPLDPRYDPTLLAEGDRRNVVDGYRYWTVEAVVADLDTRRHPFHVAIENWHHDLNIGSVVRTANAFAAAAVHVVGRRRWNRRGAMVTDRYQHVRHHDDVSALLAWAGGAGGGVGLPVIGVDNVPGSVPIETYDLPRECVLLLGQESSGLTPEALAACTAVLHISQFGSTRSINAGAAAGIALHAWVRQHADPPA
ncbi:RNA methyltransferase [Paraoerskovia sediminicola]|uniref:RNA methyltransferase n=1 Tax=Paraoerskovia sediminicola TaxID=1138587 RepID=A0ABN6X9S2_9CELL|nr:TrmH family RNA methyltransferase [Paraoerskovia sediminicola]BDZ41593.1 RNA methyltransferase [Paraoerskovia sediminicola]